MGGSNRRIGLFVLWIAGIGPLPGWAQEIRVMADFDTNTVQLGEQVHLNLSVEKPAGTVVYFPAFGDTLFDSTIEIIGKGKPDSVKINDNRILVKQSLTIAVFDTGIFYIPPVEFIWHRDQYTDTLKSRDNYLEVLSFTVDTTNTIRDIKGLYKAPVGFREVLPYGLVIFALSLATWFIIFYYRKKKRNEPLISRSKPLDPPDVAALRALDQLGEQKLWQQGKVKEYYSRLTDIIREYIEKRYGILAMEQTSYEILTGIETILQQDSNYFILRKLLPFADLVKFAKANPEPDENILHLENACLFVRNTRHQQVTESITRESIQEVGLAKMEK